MARIQAQRPRKARLPVIDGRRPWPVLIIVCWAVALAAVLVVAAVVVVRTQMPSLNNGMDRLAARGVLGVGEMLVAAAALLVFGGRRLWRNGRPAMLRVPLVATLLVALWRGIDAAVERSAGSGWVALTVLTCGGVPLALLRLPQVHRWLDAVPRTPAPVSPRAAAWQARLDPAAARLLLHAQVAGLVAALSALGILASWMYGMIDGPIVGWAVAGVSVASAAVALVMRHRWQTAVRADVERTHGLPPGTCHQVTLSDPVLFDKALGRAVRLAGRDGGLGPGPHDPSAAAPE
ncbi:hypothetical protein [Cellulomonas sp. P24]|uniref:hypothetical protein n=1 Tax=Cellulomonas sp. P24 TaxID=2885206 RepID=UPI00216B23D6|nr:hypothetical protein [Cellulomonas sp. P24]MCR6494043.1 hypothetical protein [Cellulomonas sp. P24]